MKIIVLSSQQCENKDANNGDCFIIDNGQELVLYDCGCEEYSRTRLIHIKRPKTAVEPVKSHHRLIFALA